MADEEIGAEGETVVQETLMLVPLWEPTQAIEFEDFECKESRHDERCKEVQDLVDRSDRREGLPT